jgi:hypothetical protein
MGNLKIVLDEETLKRFRETAMKKFGYMKGALSIAAREAILAWIGPTKTEVIEFKKAMRNAAGVWKKGLSGYRYTRKLRRESEKRLKRLGL